jgi:MFS family permease
MKRDSRPSVARTQFQRSSPPPGHHPTTLPPIRTWSPGMAWMTLKTRRIGRSGTNGGSPIVCTVMALNVYVPSTTKLGPTFWGPGSELIGRRPIFVCTLAIYTVFHIGQACANANDMTTSLVTRFICGFFRSRAPHQQLWRPRRHVGPFEPGNRH